MDRLQEIEEIMKLMKKYAVTNYTDGTGLALEMSANAPQTIHPKVQQALTEVEAESDEEILFHSVR